MLAPDIVYIDSSTQSTEIDIIQSYISAWPITLIEKGNGAKK